MNDNLQWLLREQAGETIIMVSPDREVERSAGATSLLERWYSPSQLGLRRLPQALLDLFSIMSRHPEPGNYPRDVWWEIGPDGTNLKVLFIPLPSQQGGPRRWIWVLKEQQSSVLVPWSWRGELTPEQQEIVTHWKRAGQAVSLNVRLTPHSTASPSKP